MTALQRTAMEARRELERLRQQEELARQRREQALRTHRERTEITRALRKLPIATLREIAAKHLPCHANTTPTSTPTSTPS